MNDRWWEDDPAVDRRAIGVVLHRPGAQWIVRRPLIGSPADIAGLKRGDVLHGLGETAFDHSARPLLVALAIDSLASDREHAVEFERGRERLSVALRPKPLRDLLQMDAERGGAALGVCKGCNFCGDVTIGVTDCKGEGGSCSDPCTVG